MRKNSVDTLIAALRFYADPENYVHLHPGVSSVSYDAGTRARRALEDAKRFETASSDDRFLVPVLQRRVRDLLEKVDAYEGTPWEQVNGVQNEMTCLRRITFKRD